MEMRSCLMARNGSIQNKSCNIICRKHLITHQGGESVEGGGHNKLKHHKNRIVCSGKLKELNPGNIKNCIPFFVPFLLEGRELLCINAALNKALSSSGDDFVFSGIKIILIQISVKAIWIHLKIWLFLISDNLFSTYSFHHWALCSVINYSFIHGESGCHLIPG